MRVGEGATLKDIELHQHTAKVMRMYGGTLGRVRVVEAKIAKWLGVKGQPTPGTRAWEAQHEVPKLEGIITERMERLKSADAGEAARLEAEVENLTAQLKEHRRTFERGDESDGVGYVAMADLPPQQKQDLMAVSQQFGSGEFASIIGRVGGVDKAVEILNQVDAKVEGNAQLRIELTAKVFDQIKDRGNLSSQDVDSIVNAQLNTEANSPQNLQQARTRRQEKLQKAEDIGLSQLQQELETNKDNLASLLKAQQENQKHIDNANRTNIFNRPQSGAVFQERDRLAREIEETQNRIQKNKPLLEILKEQQRLDRIQTESRKRKQLESETKDKDTLESKDNLSKKVRELSEDKQQKYQQYQADIDKADGEFQQIDYGRSDLAQIATQYRLDNQMKGGINVAVAEYISPDGSLQTITMPSFKGKHSERRIFEELEARGISSDKVKRLYSELEPCNMGFGKTSCKKYVVRNFSNAKVTYSFEYKDADSRKRGVRDLKKAARNIFKNK